MDISRFWLVSACRACLARHLAQHLHAATQADSCIAALLQDLALPLISEEKKVVYKDLLRQWHTDQGEDIDAMERERFGYDHPAIGALFDHQEAG